VGIGNRQLIQNIIIIILYHMHFLHGMCTFYMACALFTWHVHFLHGMCTFNKNNVVSVWLLFYNRTHIRNRFSISLHHEAAAMGFANI
jgi:hypothetical protein